MNEPKKRTTKAKITEAQARLLSFLRSPEDSYAILQMPTEPANRNRLFLSYDALRRLGEQPQLCHYETVYTGTLPKISDMNWMLEQLFEQFNLEQPQDYPGRSLSVSDIVLMKVHGQMSSHYVDSIGFKELPDFLAPEEYLRCAELYLEDDYGMLDGIINNGNRNRPKHWRINPLCWNSCTIPKRFHGGPTERRTHGNWNKPQPGRTNDDPALRHRKPLRLHPRHPEHHGPAGAG